MSHRTVGKNWPHQTECSRTGSESCTGSESLLQSCTGCESLMQSCTGCKSLMQSCTGSDLYRTDRG